MKSNEKNKKQLIKETDSLRKQLKKLGKLEPRLKLKEKKLKECVKTLEERVECRTSAERIINKQLHSEIEHRKLLELEVRESARNLSETQKIAHLGRWEYFVETHEMLLSEEELRIFGLKPASKSPAYEEYIRMIHPDDALLFEQSVNNTLQSYKGFRIENRIIRPDGAVRYVQNIAKPVLGKDGKVIKIIGTTLDITEVQERTVELNKTRQFLENIVNGIAEQIILVSKDFKILWANKTFLDQYGCTIEKIAGNYCYEITHNQKSPCQPPNDICPIMDVLKTGSPITEVHVHHTVKGEIFSEVTAYPIKDEKGEIVEFVHIARDITEQKKAEEEMRALSLTDPLTGLYNRRGFLIIAQQQMKVAKRNEQDMILLFADLDSMKWKNDVLGHQEGDSALIEVANILTNTFRESDIIARIGGDEFVVFTVQKAKGPSDTPVARLQKKLNEYNAKAVRRYLLSLSIGVAHCNADRACTIDELLSEADKLMYAQKDAKKRT